MADAIPSRILQTAKRRTLTLKQQASVKNLTLLNPGWEYCFFDDGDVERFISSEVPRYRAIFDSFPYAIQRYDFFRYLAVHRLGGFYFDLDVLLVSGLESLTPCGCVFPFEGLTFSRLLRRQGIDWEVGNYGFGAAAGHPFLGAIIENCVRAQKDRGWVEPMMRGVPRLSRAEHEILYTTGPGLVTRTLVEHPELAGAVKVLFPVDVCDPAHWGTFGSYGVHLMEGSWRLPSSVVPRRLANRLEWWRMRRLLRQSRTRGKTRHFPATACG